MTILQWILASIIGILYIGWSMISIIDIKELISDRSEELCYNLHESSKTWILTTVIAIVLLTIFSFKYGW